MKIGLLHESLNTSNQNFGGSIYLMELQDRLKEKGLDASLLTQFGDAPQVMSVKMRKSFPSFFSTSKPLKFLVLNKAFLEITKLFKDFDIVQSISWSSLPALHLIAARSGYASPFVFDCRTALFNINRSYNVYKLVALRLFKPSYMICCDSRSLMDYTRVFGTEGVSYIPTPIDIEVFRWRHRREVSGKFRILFASSLSRDKGLPDLLKSLEHIQQFCSNVELTIAGDGPLRNSILKLATEKKWLKYLGLVHHSQMPRLLNSVDLLVHPSYFEGLSRVVLEAMACEVPVITTNVGGHSALKDVVRLIPPSSPSILSKEILYMLENAEERKWYGREGRRYVKENNSWNKAVRQLIAIYESLLR